MSRTERWSMPASSLTSRLKRWVMVTRLALVAAAPAVALVCGHADRRMGSRCGHPGHAHRLAFVRPRDVLAPGGLRDDLGRVHAADRVYQRRRLSRGISARYGCSRSPILLPPIYAAHGADSVYRGDAALGAPRSSLPKGVHGRGDRPELRGGIVGIPLIPASFAGTSVGSGTARLHLVPGGRRLRDPRQPGAPLPDRRRGEAVRPQRADPAARNWNREAMQAPVRRN